MKILSDSSTSNRANLENLVETIRSHPLYFSLSIAILYGLVGVLLLSPLRPGNSLGVDDWAHVYRVSHNSTEINGHLLALLGLWLTFPLIGPNFVAYHVIWIGLWIANAFLVYLLVKELHPGQPLFPVLAGLIAIVYYQDTFYSTQMFPAIPDVYLCPTFVLLALLTHFIFVYRDGLNLAVRIAVFILSLICLAVAALMRQQSILLLGFLPIFVHLLKGIAQGRQWAGIAGWYLTLGGCASIYLLPLLGLGSATYGSDLYSGFELREVVSGSRIHFSFAIQPLLHPGRQRIFAELPLIVALFVVISLAFVVLQKIVSESKNETNKQWALAHAAWIGGSLMAAWLSFAPFLISVGAESTLYQHYLSRYSESVLLARLIVLVSEIVPLSRKGWVQLLGVLYITMAGTAMVGYVQNQLDYYGATWGTAARFMRSLDAFAPDLKDRTLLIYIENPNMFETPFTAGFSFQYAMRYFYEDRATGIIPTDSMFGSWDVTDSGIVYEERWAGTYEYRWDEVIFIGRQEDGTVTVMEQIPDPYYRPDRQALYAPASRVVPGPINERILQAYPAYATALP